jgi:uncharacterized spore protein YtfJ
MKASEALQRATDALTVERVFAPPYEKDGVTVIPAAIVIGGGGGGNGRDPKGQEGEGGGFGLISRPAGAYVIKDGHVSWRPAVDPARLLLVAGALALYAVRRTRALRPRIADDD